MAIDNVPIDDITDMMNDIEGMMDSSTVSEEELQPTKEVGAPLTDDDTDLSDADQPLDIQMLLSNTTYIGEVPYSTIVECITSQFEDYIGITDRSDYVDIFYDQLDESYSVINDEDEFHDEKRYFLDPPSRFTTIDGVVFAVCHQWGNQFDKFRKYVEDKLGWMIEEI